MVTPQEGNFARSAVPLAGGTFRQCTRCVAQRIFKSGGRYAKQVKGIDCDRPTRRWWLRPVTHSSKRDQATSRQSMRSLHSICRSRRSSAESESPIGAEDPWTRARRRADWPLLACVHWATCSWLSPGLEFVEGL